MTSRQTSEVESRREAEVVQVNASRGGLGIGRDLLIQQFMDSADKPPPKADSPDLTTCPHCGRPWISRLAMLCPGCGYNFQLARSDARQERQARIQMTIVLPLLAVIALVTYPRDTTSNIQQISAAVSATMAVVLIPMFGFLAWMWFRWWRREVHSSTNGRRDN